MDNQSIVKLHSVAVYQREKLVLQNVDMDIKNGEFVYLIGKTGSGKSSLLQILYADLDLKEGEGTVCGYDLNKLRKKDVPYLRRKMGIVFQDFQLLEDRNVEENFRFVLKATGWKDKNEINQRILEVLEQVGMLDKLNVMPHRLSGGEQQRISIARSLLNHPELILADEPTGNLDPETSNGIMRLLLQICDTGKAVIMATHNYNIIHKFPGKIVKCEDGLVISSTNKLN
ncbi:MAG: phosphonate ABC transporter ATP-binding protein [Bacteroidetes bacterium]|nr:MAG: phosphonate ABC transporter ATP-binding protein [Bacteroidota bacterium]RLD86892.1 MAG: phosphonate ABC transporter ATP-binding protein [Bacteroidota bacterium]